MKFLRKSAAAAVGAVMFLSACGARKAPESSVNIEDEIAERFSVTEENKYLLEDSVQDVFEEEENDGVTLLVRQVIAYENMLCILADADMDERFEKITDEYTVGADIDFSVEGREHLTRSGSWEIHYDEEENSLTYLGTYFFDKPKLEEGMTLNFLLKEISKREAEFPPEAFDENGEIREDYETEEILWRPEEPLTVSWTLEKVGKSVEIDIDDESILDGIIALTPLYVYVSANKSDYAHWFYPEKPPETEEELRLWALAGKKFAKTVRLGHKNGYYIDAYDAQASGLDRLTESTGAFKALRPFFTVLDPEEVEYVEIMYSKYELNKN